MNNVLAMVLAGGRGERMKQLCITRPKPSLPIAGNLKAIDFCLSNCFYSGIRKIAVITGYQRSVLITHLESWAKSNNRHTCINIIEPGYSPYSGTADAVWQNIDLVMKSSFEYIVILAADHVYKMNYQKLLQFHMSKKADITVGATQVPVEHAHRYGILTTGADGRILEFQEKPTAPAGNLASMGIYVFSRQALLELLASDSKEANSRHDFGYSIVPSALNRKRVFAYKFTGYWRDIGTVEAYYRSNMELIDKLHLLTAGNKWPVLAQDDVITRVKTPDPNNIVHSLVSPGSIVRGKVENSVLSPGVIVGEHAVVKNSIILPKSTVGDYSHVDGCIIDEDVDIGKLCFVGLKGKSSDGMPAITLIGRGVSIPSHTAVLGGVEVFTQKDLAISALRAGDREGLVSQNV